MFAMMIFKFKFVYLNLQSNMHSNTYQDHYETNLQQLWEVCTDSA